MNDDDPLLDGGTPPEPDPPAVRDAPAGGRLDSQENPGPMPGHPTPVDPPHGASQENPGPHGDGGPPDPCIALAAETDPADALSAAPMPAEEPPPSAFEALYGRVGRIVPWISLALSVAGAVAVDRSEGRGPWIAAAAAAGWIVLVVISLAHRSSDATSTSRLRKVARFASTAASQSLLQLSLFFCAPFYVEASAWTVPQCAFAAVFALAAAITLWDPLCARVLLHPAGGPCLTAFSNFVGWNAALPMLGVPQRTAVGLAAISVAVGLPLTRLLQGARGRALAYAVATAVALPVLLLLGGIRAIPPAPLRVVSAGLGTQVRGRELVDPTRRFDANPGAVVCHTAIRAPSHLKDRLEHVWTLNGEELSRRPLALQGGRKRGFRTWSRLRLPRDAEGTLRCEVQNAFDQTLGGATAQILPKL